MELVRTWFILISAMAAVTTVVHALPLTYTFTGSHLGPSPAQQAFTYVAPDFITSTTFVPSAALTGCTNCGSGLTFYPNVPVSVFPDVPHAEALDFGGASVGQYFFPLGAFTQPGTYTALTNLVEQPLAGIGTLVVATAPEPSTWISILPVLVIGLLWQWRLRSSCRHGCVR